MAEPNHKRPDGEIVHGYHQAITTPDTFQPIGTAAANVAAQLPLPPPYYSGVTRALARYRARKAVEHKLRSQGVLVQYIPPRDIITQAMEYLRQHPELLDECAECVRNDPKLRTLAEREKRERLRKWKREMRGR
jgi:hypothetical protein